MPSVLTARQRADFDRDGYVMVRQFFNAAEALLLQQAVERDPAIRRHFYNRADADGLATRMATWNHPGDSVYGYAARSHKMVDTMEDLLGGEGPGSGTRTMAIGTRMGVCFRPWPPQ